MDEVEVGVVTHYFSKIGVAGIKLSAPVLAGDTLRIKGHTSDFNVKVDSIQVEHTEVKSAGPGDLIGIKVPDRVREHDKVYKIT